MPFAWRAPGMEIKAHASVLQWLMYWGLMQDCTWWNLESGLFMSWQNQFHPLSPHLLPAAPGADEPMPALVRAQKNLNVTSRFSMENLFHWTIWNYVVSHCVQHTLGNCWSSSDIYTLETPSRDIWTAKLGADRAFSTKHELDWLNGCQTLTIETDNCWQWKMPDKKCEHCKIGQN